MRPLGGLSRRARAALLSTGAAVLILLGAALLLGTARHGGPAAGAFAAAADAPAPGAAAAGPTSDLAAAEPASLRATLAPEAASDPDLDFWSPGDPSPRAAELLDSLSDEEVLGQVFMLSYPAEEPPPLIFSWIEERGIGGIKIFGRNAEDTERLARAVASLQTASLARHRGIPLLIATDQEGGWIRHVKGATSQTPGNMAIGASGRPSDAYRSALLIGRELLALGVTMNFAPTVDLATRPKSAIIGPRAFGEDPMESAALGAAWAKGMLDAGVIPTAKHYPGHGDTELDSHGVLPVIYKDEATIWERELVPFRLLAAEGVPAIMSGHLAFPLVTGKLEAASISKRFMTDILRGRIGFEGVAVTDDLAMNGVAGLSYAEVCLKAMEAGNDLLESSRSMELDDAAWLRMLAEYRARPAFRERVREAAGRVLRMKLERLRPLGKEALVPDPARLAGRVPDPEAAEFFREQAFRGATALDPGLIPLVPKGRVLVAAPLGDFLAAGTERLPGARQFRFSYRPEAGALPEELAAFEAALAGAETVVVCVANEAGMDFALLAAERGKRVGIVSLLSPAPLARRPARAPAIAVYGQSRSSIEAGLDALLARSPAPGRLPVKLGR